jgi:hypothetical protein
LTALFKSHCKWFATRSLLSEVNIACGTKAEDVNMFISCGRKAHEQAAESSLPMDFMSTQSLSTATQTPTESLNRTAITTASYSGSFLALILP